jgi:thioredoxin 1
MRARLRHVTPWQDAIPRSARRKPGRCGRGEAYAAMHMRRAHTAGSSPILQTKALGRMTQTGRSCDAGRGTAFRLARPYNPPLPSTSTGQMTKTEFSYDVTETIFDDAVVARSHLVPVLVDIGADWCAPCRVLGPMLEKLAAEYRGKFVLAKVAADENMRIAGKHKVRGFPTVIAYSHGRETGRFHSAQPEHFLRHFIDQVIAQHRSLAQQPN